MRNKAIDIVGEVKKVIIGKDEVVEKVLMVMLAGGHILLEDVPGVGKTTMALAFSRAMSLDYKRLQFTPDTMASDVTGYGIYNRESGEIEYHPGAVLCNLFLGDEINRTSAKTQAALLEVMEEGGVTVDGITHKTPDPFICIATQNPLGSAGTQNLPESQLDRFMARLSIGYPTISNQIDIIKARQGADPLDSVRPVATKRDITDMRRECAEVYANDDVIGYAAALCEETRRLPEAEQGVSPRAVIALVQMAKARAFLLGRDYVIPDDVRDLFPDVCAHRLVLTAQARIRKHTQKEVLMDAVRTVPSPPIA